MGKESASLNFSHTDCIVAAGGCDAVIEWFFDFG